MSEQTAIAKLNQQIVARGVLIKLVIFTLALAIAPLGSYFGSLKYLWDGNSTYAAITAVMSANVVLVVYIIMSLLEDQSTPAGTKETKEDTKKDK
ncbi:hypothetical protein HGRIS_009746 [Hohenbuehelia grisea]|uniref:Vacuolar ATPase assembly integral membrane protein VMA21 n=1 Tax=Hohenbuehelia grisea TaxID=104357 RepID=A0ABR3J295_9AGAR